MHAAYVFRVTFTLDTRTVTADPDTFETVVTRPAADPGTEGWLFFRDTCWHGEVSDEAYLRDRAEEWLSVPVSGVTFSELRTDEAYLDALRDAIADDPAFDESPREALHNHLGSSIRVTD
ncbi:LWR-salt protein [Haloplanus litoreus]|uniref:LWR-salt protein n=1 Tax=Haloplanus litoreus TaxID=767515 RepID=A0ABD5ZWT7_9EURY